jgi:diguanylate cyclase (GGDEF)-like protein
LSRIGSFKIKLVAWFALLALVPLGIAFYGYGKLAERSETRRADATLEGELRTAVFGLSARLDAASAQAQQLASEPGVQDALRRHDRAALRRLLRAHPNARLGTAPEPSRSATVVSGGHVLGRISVRVPLDAFLRSVSAGFPRGDRIVRDTSPARLGTLPGTVTMNGVRYRAVSTGSFVALTPQHAIDAAARRSLAKLAGVLIALLIVMTGATYLLGHSIVSTLRRLAGAARAIADGHLDRRVDLRGRDEFAEAGAAFNDMADQLNARLHELELARAHAREANARFGAALAATLDPAQLLQIVVETAVEATGASGGFVQRTNGEHARTGDPHASGRHVTFPLRAGSSDFGMLVLTGDAFGEEQIETAASLAAQAVVALENARLHRIVERQALLDGLTGLANRRALEDGLRGELARAARFGDKVCFVLADLDDFKRVNDRYGHPTGDDALRFFAETLAATVREMDVAGRWGGEEFALVLPGTDAEGGRRLAERARVALEERSMHAEDGSVIRLTASFGVAAYPDEGDLEGLIAAADAALYEAKRTGKNRVMV